MFSAYFIVSLLLRLRCRTPSFTGRVLGALSKPFSTFSFLGCHFDEELRNAGRFRDENRNRHIKSHENNGTAVSLFKKSLECRYLLPRRVRGNGRFKKRRYSVLTLYAQFLLLLLGLSSPIRTLATGHCRRFHRHPFGDKRKKSMPLTAPPQSGPDNALRNKVGYTQQKPLIP